MLDDQFAFTLPKQSAALEKKKEEQIDKTIKGEVSRVRSEKKGLTGNRALALRILDLNPDLPAAFKSKFEVMVVNTHFSTNVQLVIEDCYKNGIKLKLSEGETNPVKLRKTGDGL